MTTLTNKDSVTRGDNQEATKKNYDVKTRGQLYTLTANEFHRWKDSLQMLNMRADYDTHGDFFFARKIKTVTEDVDNL